MKKETVKLKNENEALKRLLLDLHWMARRQADGGQEAFPGFNENTKTLLGFGIKLNPTGDGTIWVYPGEGNRPRDIRRHGPPDPEEIKFTKAQAKAAKPKTRASAAADNAVLRSLAQFFHPLAREYADGRRTYATGMMNDATRALLAMGIELPLGEHRTIWARDGQGRPYDHLTEEEAVMGIK